MNALVTGAGGFLGLYIVEQLAARGDHVRALCRRRHASLDALGVEIVEADIRDRQATRNACRGMNVVFHAAGVTGIVGPWRHYYEVNTLGRSTSLKDVASMASAGWYTPALPASPSTATISAELTSRPLTLRIGCRTIRTARPWPSNTCWRPAAATGCSLCVTAAFDLGPARSTTGAVALARAAAGRLRRVGDGSNLIDMVYVENAASAHLLAAEP